MVLATQAYPNPLKPFHYRVLPFYVYNIATEPLSPRQMDELQLPGRENTFNAENLYWAVRPRADNRLVFTECDALYFYHIDRDHGHRPRAYERHQRLLLEKFPFLEGIRVTHRWGDGLVLPWTSYLRWAAREDTGTSTTASDTTARGSASASSQGG
jgi:hypothetical protein